MGNPFVANSMTLFSLVTKDVMSDCTLSARTLGTKQLLSLLKSDFTRQKISQKVIQLSRVTLPHLQNKALKLNQMINLKFRVWRLMVNCLLIYIFLCKQGKEIWQNFSNMKIVHIPHH